MQNLPEKNPEIHEFIDNVRKPKILVVDDSRLVRVTLHKMLGSKFEVLDAEDGEAGWELMLKKQGIKVVLTDAGMPKLDGFGLISRTRQHDDPEINKLPLIMITGAEEGQTEIRERAYDCGASDFIIKPFDKIQLIARVSSYIKQDDLQQELVVTNKTLDEQTTIDPFSKCHNKRYFIERANQELALAKRRSMDLSFVGIGVDCFKHIEENQNRDSAGKIILWLKNLLQPLLRKEDSLTHTNDDKFIIIAPATNRMGAAQFCGRLRKTIAESPYLDPDIAVAVTVTLGLLNIPKDEVKCGEDIIEKVHDRINYGQFQGGGKLVSTNPPEGYGEEKKITTTDTRSAVEAYRSSQLENGENKIEDLAKHLLPIFDQLNAELKWELNEHLDAIRKKFMELQKENKSE